MQITIIKPFENSLFDQHHSIPGLGGYDRPPLDSLQLIPINYRLQTPEDSYICQIKVKVEVSRERITLHTIDTCYA